MGAETSKIGVQPSGMGVEENRTGTNIEAYFDWCTGWMVWFTRAASDTLSSQGAATRVASVLNQLVWATPLLALKPAPITFLGAAFCGAFTQIFSSTNMKQIFANVDNILSGGEDNKNTNFKVSLIFACVIANEVLPIFPSLPMFYAAAGGTLLGIKMGQWIPATAAKSIAQFIDDRLPLPTCPGFVKKPLAD